MAVEKYIIACKVGGVDNYILKVNDTVKKLKTPFLTRDVEKARRFTSVSDAQIFISKLTPIPTRKYVVEEFAPAALVK